MTESTAFDEAIEEGELRGKISNSHQTLLRLGHKQFGVPDEATELELKSIRDLDRLELIDAILTAKSWLDMLATP